ncbi:MAG: tryptophan synthase subunit alpha [Methanofollis sp.]|uniref:tryptophan synthase subunit alpha n=1 Tax=Methanofollis sp. TaxID=2052835 RepID=UPI00260E89F8|nr:tryptophan synthase subunit alpha [Methanofollis sp.]MDD4255529.1 tryptophan synthase subunit alpha [Methanofollis sp.]
MSRIDALFSGIGRPACIAYLTGGDPDPATSLAALRSVVDAGADIIEIGVPFTDPIADGPTIRRANARALAAGTTPDRIFDLVRAVREGSPIPIVLMTAYNIVYVRGIDRFYREAAEAGADGVIIPDMPPEESGAAGAAARRYGLDQVFLVAPNTPEERLDPILEHASGFLYLVSVQGVTGARAGLPPGMEGRIAAMQSRTFLPIAVGFGISGPDQARALAAAGADGVIVGSAIVEIVERHGGDRAAMCAELKSFVAVMREAVGDRA